MLNFSAFLKLQISVGRGNRHFTGKLFRDGGTARQAALRAGQLKVAGRAEEVFAFSQSLLTAQAGTRKEKSPEGLPVGFHGWGEFLANFAVKTEIAITTDEVIQTEK